MSRYRMEAYGPEQACTCRGRVPSRGEHHDPGCPTPTTPWRWQAMDRGPAKSAWKPRKTALEAATRAYAWSQGIPAMRVVEIATGTVVWQYDHPVPAGEARDPRDQPGDNVLPDWHRLVVEGAHRIYTEDARQEAQERATAARWTPDQEALF